MSGDEPIRMDSLMAGTPILLLRVLRRFDVLRLCLWKIPAVVKAIRNRSPPAAIRCSP